VSIQIHLGPFGRTTFRIGSVQQIFTSALLEHLYQFYRSIHALVSESNRGIAIYPGGMFSILQPVSTDKAKKAPFNFSPDPRITAPTK
jgi:succinylglutamate desuccinylase